MKQRPTYAEWMELPTEQRHALVLQFKINKSTGVRVQNKRVISDGVAEQDLENALHLGKMIEFLGDDWKKGAEYDSEGLADALWAMVLLKMFGKEPEEEVKPDFRYETAPIDVDTILRNEEKNINIETNEKLSTEKIN